MDNNGLIRVRSFGSVTRRDVMKGAAAMGVMAASGLGATAASAATTVSLFGWQGYDEGLRVGDFLAKNDIEVNFTPIGNNDEIVTRLASGGVGQMDLVTPYMGYVPLMVAAELLDPVDESLVPNLAKVPEVFRNDSNLVIDGVRYAVPFTWGSGPMAYDPAAFSAPPTSWKVILEDSLKGKVGMMDDPIGNQMLAAIIATDAKVATELTKDQLDQATEFLIKLKKDHVRTLSASWGELADALARNEIVVTFSGGEFLKKFVADKGKVIEFTYPEEGTFGWLDSYCIGKNAPNREAAHKLANQVLEADAQLAFTKSTLQGIVNPDAIAQLPPELNIYPYNDLAGFQKKAAFYPMPPMESGGEYASWTEWQEAYQRFKAA